jgi:SAM-dependent methyltransferase
MPYFFEEIFRKFSKYHTNKRRINMKPTEKEEIRQAVRERYGKVARAGTISSTDGSGAGCCGEVNAADGADPAISCGCGQTGISLERMSEAIGYSSGDFASVPEGANMGLGCGNPVALASIKPGETVVDLGSGGGFDCFLAAKEVGETGHIIGVDMTSDMIHKARKNAEEMGGLNVEFRLGEIENLPVADNTADLIMSNCVINLSPSKGRVYRESFRVLKPGGRLAISDIVATAQLPDEIRNDLELVGACVGGAATIEETKKSLQEAGFQDINIIPKENSRELLKAWDPGKTKNAADYVVSANIEARKPS